MGRTWIVLIAVLLCAGCAQVGPTARDLVNDGSNTDHVLTYGMGYSQNRYSTLSQINKTNVKKLVPVWSLGLENNLGDAVAVAQVDEDLGIVGAGGIDPAVEGDA